MSAHTPGPWKPIRQRIYWSVYSEHTQVAEGSSENDARLIAAAPRMLDAVKNLKMWATHAKDGGVMDWAAVVNYARAILRDVEGTNG